MRIISGSAKGRKLAVPPEREMTIRPTSDRAREALFSIIGAEIVEARVLDLFAGTGALGCEALSRGARSVVFVDNNKAACELIRKNIGLIPDGTHRAAILKHDLRRGLGPRIAERRDYGIFDLIFADPPYQKGFSEKILLSLDDCPVLSDNVLVIIEEKKDVVLPDQLVNLSLASTRRYGDTVFTFYRRKNHRSTSALPESTP